MLSAVETYIQWSTRHGKSAQDHGADLVATNIDEPNSQGQFSANAYHSVFIWGCVASLTHSTHFAFERSIQNQLIIILLL